MPYMKGYESAIKKDGSLLIVWDRFNVEDSESNVIVYRDGKIGMQRTLLDYIKFSLFVFFRAPVPTSSVIFFGTPVFLFCCLKFMFVKNLYLDVRDWHPSWRYVPGFFKNRLSKVFISSHKFSQLLDVSDDKIVISHNCWSDYSPGKPIDVSGVIKISYIGAIRDAELNLALINSLKGCSNIELIYNGDGVSVDRIEKEIIDKSIKNVKVTGRYDPGCEHELYCKSTMINSLVSPFDINSRALLTNRLYNAVLSSRPLLVLRGTYLSEVVEEYGLGLIVDGFDNLDFLIKSYFKCFDPQEFQKSCEKFFSVVSSDMNKFYSSVDAI